jgi:isopentenyldiphosphate isomerase
MENERLKIFDDNRNEVGVATRMEVHEKGYWHETFHCWFISQVEGKDFIYFQLRSLLKKDYPNLLDITAAGHILAHETIEDGVREVKEETGIHVSMSELIPLGVVDYSVTSGHLIDKEFAHVFLYHKKDGFEGFQLQTEEVAGMVRCELVGFLDLWTGKSEHLSVEGFVVNNDGAVEWVHNQVKKDRFVPHENSYYERIMATILEKRKI